MTMDDWTALDWGIFLVVAAAAAVSVVLTATGAGS
jgi:hypothetical protein